MVTIDQLTSFFEDTDNSILQTLVDPFNKTFDKYDISTKNRVAMFLAQVGFESSGLTKTSENLNYSAQRLMEVFPKYFHNVDPNDYAHNPEKIANRVYANRMGNDDEDSGEGYKFRGRGFIQLTGHTNYSLFGENIGMDVDQVVDYLETPEGAAMSAGWFWHRCHLNDWADRGDVVMCTRRINGGLNGLADRKTLYKEALTVF